MMKFIFKNAWKRAYELANRLGGRAIEYISYTLKLYWRLAKIQVLKAQIFVIKYTKKEDNYSNNYFTLGTNLKNKINKAGEPYLQAITHKGYRNYKFYELQQVNSLKGWKDISKQLINTGWELA